MWLKVWGRFCDWLVHVLVNCFQGAWEQTGAAGVARAWLNWILRMNGPALSQDRIGCMIIMLSWWFSWMNHGERSQRSRERENTLELYHKACEKEEKVAEETTFWASRQPGKKKKSPLDKKHVHKIWFRNIISELCNLKLKGEKNFSP